MRVEIIRNHGDLKRERWLFRLSMNGDVRLYLCLWAFETRETKRHSWRSHGFWDRTDSRSSTVGSVIAPPDVVAEAKLQLGTTIAGLPVLY